MPLKYGHSLNIDTFFSPNCGKTIHIPLKSGQLLIWVSIASTVKGLCVYMYSVLVCITCICVSDPLLVHVLTLVAVSELDKEGRRGGRGGGGGGGGAIQVNKQLS